MNIGILTYHFSNNYGAVLQTYALMEYLRKANRGGYNVLIINRTPIKADVIHWLYRLLNSNSSLFWRKFHQFDKEMLRPITKPYYKDNEMAYVVEDYGLDAIIVGSDQIWRGTMCGHSYFLNFLHENAPVKRISYAASFGTSQWDTSRKDTEYIKALLGRFDSVSVRENTGVDICHDVFGIDAELVLDPTMLHDASFYEENVIGDSMRKPSGKVVSYILGKSALPMVAAANQFAASVGKVHNELYWLSKDLSGLKLSDYERHNCHITVPEWLKEVRDADYVITNSFHCVVFSILFQKQFVVVEYEVGGNDRLYTLLSALGLTERITGNLSAIGSILKRQIAYSNCNSRLDTLKARSKSFLSKALES